MTEVPPAMPLLEFAKLLEKRCSSCHGGVRATVTWLTFACFLALWGAFSHASVYALQLGYMDWRQAVAANPWRYFGPSCLWLLSLAAVSLICMRFLIINCALDKGAVPKKDEPNRK
jgi:hypothetical protein